MQIERRIAPFWRGLNDHSDDWKEHQLIAVVRGKSLPNADDVPPADSVRVKQMEDNLNSLTVPITSRTASYQSDSSSNLSPLQPAFAIPNASPGSASSLLRGRAKTLASLSTSNKGVTSGELTPRETHLPEDSYVNGQPIEVYLYKDSLECPICFLYCKFRTLDAISTNVIETRLPERDHC